MNAEPDGMGFGEPDVWWSAIRKPGKGFVTYDLSAGKLLDG